MSSVLCAGTEPGDAHINAVGVSPVTTTGAGTLASRLKILDLPQIVNSTVTPTNFTFGNAVHTSQHILDGKTMYFWWRVIFGTTSTFAATGFIIAITGSTPHLGTGNVKDRMPVGNFKISNAAKTDHYYGQIILRTTPGLSFRYIDDTGLQAENLVRQGVPITFGDGTIFSGYASYEVN